MSSSDSNPAVGQFVWYELMTSDAAAAKAFYTQVLEWTAAEAGSPEQPYTLLSADSAMVAGLMTLPPEACAQGARPGWVGYVAVADVDAAAARLAAAGGQVLRPGQDIPGVGRFAVVADPQGAVFNLFTGSDGDAPPTAPMGTPGFFGWHELHAQDQAGALAFYAEQFGWRATEAIDMGPMGTYQLFVAGSSMGGMMNKLPMIPMPFWLYYINVAELGAALGRVKAAGGQVLNGPSEVPGGWTAQCMDPQGAMFALFSTQNEG